MRESSSSPDQITVLVISGSTMMTLASVIDPMRASNRLSNETEFDWKLVSADGQPVELSGGLRFPVNDALLSTESGSMLIVIASFDHQKHASAKLVRTLRSAARGFDFVCGVEAGTWLLARAGLVGGRRVTTHWEDLENLQQRYPDTDVTDERFVVDGKVWSCGGASPALDMMLFMIENWRSPQLALDVASVFVYDQFHTRSDKQPAASQGLLKQNAPLVAATISTMEKTLDSPLPISAIARRHGVSVKTLESQFKRSLLLTPGRYYLNLRLKMARKLAMDTRLGMQEIAIRTGFGSQSAFSRAFRSSFGMSPLQIRQNSNQFVGF